MKRSGIVLSALCLALAALSAPALADTDSTVNAPHLMPLNPDVVEAAKALDKTMAPAMTEARFIAQGGRLVNQPLPAQALAAGQEVRALVLLVDFTDVPPGGPVTRYSEAVFDSMLFGETYLRGGLDTTTDRTLKNFYHEISYGAVDIVTLHLPGATGWVTAPNDYAYYCEPDGIHDNGFGPYPRNVQRLVMDAVLAADPYVDFSEYAPAGEVENLFIVHAGSGAEWNGGPTLIWSHAWSINTNDGWGTVPPNLYVDGVQVTHYSIEPECGGDTTGETGTVSGPFLPTVGVYAHEFGHVLGLPDEYDYGYESQGTGRFSLMAGGSWNRTPNVTECAGNSPAHPSAWGKTFLGFIEPVEVTSCLPGASIPPIETTNVDALYKLTNPDSGGMEYWLVENRQQIGFDEGLIRMAEGAHGLVIYHIDENVLDNSFWRPNEAECVGKSGYLGEDNCDCQSAPVASNGERWYGISIEQADGLYELELGTSAGTWQDFYSGASGFTDFDGTTVPNSTSYANCATPVAVRNISGNIGTMTADLYGAARCQVTPGAIDFGVVAVGDHADTTVTITNVGSGTLAGDVTMACADFSILGGGGPFSLAAGQSVVVTLRFEPTVSGPLACTLETGSDCCGPVPLSGVGEEEAPVCLVEPTVLDFGTVVVGSFADTTFAITNTGGGLLAGDVAELCDDFDILAGGGPFSLAAGDTVFVQVRFQPTAAGPAACAVETGSSECGQVALSGAGEDPPACLVEPAALDFGTVAVGAFADTTFTITNTGGGLLAGEVTEPCDEFDLLEGAGPFNLAAGDTLLVRIRFQPTSAGAKACAVETGSPECGQVALSGAGEDPPACLVVPTSLDFGTVLVGAIADSTFTITNTGGGTLSGNVESACADFSIVSGGGAFDLGAGQSVSVTVRFAPTVGDTLTCAVATGDTLCGGVALAGIGNDVSDVPMHVSAFSLRQNNPNPFNPQTVIGFDLPQGQSVRLTVYTVDGRLVRTLVNESLPAGRHEVTWTGRDQFGRPVSSGIYFYRLETPRFTQTRRMTLLK